MGVLALLIGRLPLGEGGPPAEFDGLATGSAEQVATHILRDGGLPVPEVPHHRGQVSAGDDVKQPSLVGR